MKHAPTTRWLERDGYRLHARAEGPANAPVLLLSNSLGATLRSWEPQVAALAERFLVLRYDNRGHGRSSAQSGDYTLADLGQDALAVLDAFEVERAHVCGLSIGGMVAQWLAIHARARVDRLVLCNTASRIGTREAWATRIALVQQQGVAALAAASIERWFTPDFRAREPATIERVRSQLLETTLEGYVGCCAALRDADLTSELGQIESKTQVIGATFDPATPPTDTLALASRIALATHVELAAAHLSNLEAVADFNQALSDHLA